MSIGVFSNIAERFSNRQKKPGSMRFDMVTEQGNGFYAWNGKVYQSDIVLSAITPRVKALSKLVPKHLKETTKEDEEGKSEKSLEINPEPFIKLLLKEPNPYMSMQKLLEKMAMQLAINKNCFVLVMKNAAGIPLELYPLPCDAVEAIYSKQGELFLKFIFPGGKTYTFPYSNIIHMRENFNSNDIFGDSIMPALAPLMEVVNTTDQGIVKAIKNSAVIRWLLKFESALRPEDLKKQTEDFAKNYLELSNDSVGVAGVDSKGDAKQIEPKDYVPNAAQMDRTRTRILSLFNTNEKIVQSNYTEDEYVSYYEAEIAPVISELGHGFETRILKPKARAAGESIVFESSRLTTASMKTKLNLVNFVDRGIMTPNEVRFILNLAPILGGDVAVRRLDTAAVTENGKTEKEEGEGGEDK